MQIEIQPNPNCMACDLTVFKESGPAKSIRSLRAEVDGVDTWCDVVSVMDRKTFAKAWVRQIADSGEGSAFLIYGGPMGIRLRPERFAQEVWDLANAHQWGEPYKIYGNAEDLVLES